MVIFLTRLCRDSPISHLISLKYESHFLRVLLVFLFLYPNKMNKNRFQNPVLEVDPQIYSSPVKITTLRVVQLIDGSIVHLQLFIGLSSISNSVGSQLSAFYTVKWH
jgi:hypothetical protein